MKNKKVALVLLIVTVVAIMPACKKKSTEEAPVIAPAATAGCTATVNGVSKSFPANYYQAISGGTYIQAGAVTATAAPYIQLSIALSQTTGTYTVGSTGVQAAYKDANNIGHSGSSGTITISSIANNKISGTFSFTETGGTSVTNGVFTDIPKQ